MKKVILLQLLGFIAVVIFTSCDPVKLTCSDGRTALSYKHPEKRYPAFVKANENKFKGTINILEKIKIADIDASTKATVTELRDKLDNESSRFEILAKTAYFNFNQDPCKPNDEYYKLLSRITDLESLRVSLENALNSGGIGGVDDSKVKKAVSEYTSKASQSIF